MEKLLSEHVKQIPYRHDKSIYVSGPVALPVAIAGQVHNFKWYCWFVEEAISPEEPLIAFVRRHRLEERQVSSALVYGDFETQDQALVRIHSTCHTGDIFGSEKCDCGPQLKHAFERIVEQGTGAIFYLANHEGRSIGLFAKNIAYKIQELGFDTVQANEIIGYGIDERRYEETFKVIRYLRSGPIQLITNNPEKVEEARKAGIHVSDVLVNWVGGTIHNRNYMDVKIKKTGHLQVSPVISS
ncbi:GTP cyclohydrolase II [Paenibacillus sp. GCM10012307]